MPKWPVLKWHILNSFMRIREQGTWEQSGWDLRSCLGDWVFFIIKTEKWAFYLEEKAYTEASRLARAQYSPETVSILKCEQAMGFPG